MALINHILEKYNIDRQLQLVPVKCLSAAPFTVGIAGDTTPIPAKKISGQTFDLNDVGMALWMPPSAPICFKIS